MSDKVEKQTEPLTWEERIERTGYTKNKGKQEFHKVAMLHDDRFKLWTTFIDRFCESRVYNESGERKLRSRMKPLSKSVCLRKTSKSTTPFEKYVVLMGNTWARITLMDDEGHEKCKFDADFGSLGETSDLDVNVLSNDTQVIKDWIYFLTEKERDGTTFSAYYDSNFYFEPAIELENGTLVSKAKHVLEDIKLKDKLLPDKDTIVFAMDTIVKYTEAYMNGEGITLEREETEDNPFIVYPNPTSDEFGHEQEIQQYNAMEYFAKKCWYTKEGGLTMERYMNFGCTKSEGFLSIMSLAISGVFGDFMKNNLSKKIYEFKDDTSWRLITALEMLYNLKMHMHSDKVKTKYVKRLNDTLLQSKFTCGKGVDTSIRQKVVRNLKTNQINNRTTLTVKINNQINDGEKELKIQDALKTINVLVLDEINLYDCDNSVTSNDIDSNIERIKKEIRRLGNKKLRTLDRQPTLDRLLNGIASGETDDLQSIALYHQFVNLMDSDR